MKKIINIVSCILISTMILTSCSTESDSNNTNNDTQTETNDNSSETLSNFDSEYTITVVSREDGSGTRGAFTELMGIEVEGSDGSVTDETTEDAVIGNSTDIVMKNIINDTYSIGYISLGSLNDSVKAVDIDGISASDENVENGSYPVARPFNIVTSSNVSEISEDFISFILSQEGQNIVSDGYIPLDSDYSFESTMPDGKIVIAGSTSVTPIMEELIEGYNAINPNVTIELQSNGSSAGINAVIDGTADIGMASRDLKDSEKDSVESTVIAIDGIAVIVNNDCPIDDLTSEQVREIFTGETTVWDEVIS